MGLQEYLGQHEYVPELAYSLHESLRSGLKVARLTCGVHTNWSQFDPSRTILDSDYDLVVLRYASDQVSVAEQLQVSGLKSWIADTLIYFSVEVDSVLSPDPSTRFTPITARDAGFDALLDLTFRNYKNHYASNSHLHSINISDAYADWVRNQVDSKTGHCYGFWNSANQLSGLGVLESNSDDTNELTLVGVHPDQRGKGSYLQIIRHLAQVTASEGKRELVTSTQSSNIPSMRAWCKEGFLPTLSINTIHVMPVR